MATNADVWEAATQPARTCRAQGVTAPATGLLIASRAETQGLFLLHHNSDFDLLTEALRG